MTFCFCTLQNLNGRIVNQNGEQIGEWSSSLPAFAGDIRNAGHGKGSPTNSNRNSGASSDSGRGYSTGHLDHANANVKVSKQVRETTPLGQSGPFRSVQIDDVSLKGTLTKMSFRKIRVLVREEG